MQKAFVTHYETHYSHSTNTTRGIPSGEVLATLHELVILDNKPHYIVELPTGHLQVVAVESVRLFHDDPPTVKPVALSNELAWQSYSSTSEYQKAPFAQGTAFIFYRNAFNAGWKAHEDSKL